MKIGAHIRSQSTSISYTGSQGVKLKADGNHDMHLNYAKAN